MSNFEELENILFKFIEKACISEGGDGDVAMISPNYRELSDKFQRWCELNNNKWWNRSNNDEFIQFYNGQECIWFCKDRKYISPYNITSVESIFI